MAGLAAGAMMMFFASSVCTPESDSSSPCPAFSVGIPADPFFSPGGALSSMPTP